MPAVFEIPVFSAAAAKVAVEHGATRLEVNRTGSYAAGGLTPTRAEVEAVSSALGPTSTVPLRVMIRPRGPPSSDLGEPDFLYTDDEFREMRSDLEAFVASGLLRATRGDGFVFGILAREDGKDGQVRIDADRNRQLVQAAEPYACVFHRAFDLVLGSDATNHAAEEGLAALRDCGFAGVLTAGGPGKGGAVDHADTLQALVAAERDVAGAAQARPHASIEIVVGGGVRSQNVSTLEKAILGAKKEEGRHTSVVSFHSSCLEDAAAATAKGAEAETVSGEEVRRIHAALGSVEGW
ncbi:copper homeostasis protein [Sporothrix brasiliensis 5110]|uniref:Copper homeostasis protein cutC homolog n=1 Tax=Sporothrix brasiliensis 5110 TaxID=1398154 RepID=A0A0C2IH33_9PEZI|nr:copper homeostasis protein [Sporothrix brasiliensis 5110]KIH88526.1 copper homeostasis protein [Sporothrix brasiliensis 5110]